MANVEFYRALVPTLVPAALALCLIVGGTAAAQQADRDGVVKRRELKGAGSPDKVLTVAGASVPKEDSTKLCNTNGVCETPLLVFRGGYKQGDPKWYPDDCSVFWPYFQIKVQNGFKPILRWVLVKSPEDKDSYEFHPTRGIRLDKNKQDLENDANLDLAMPRLEAKTAFVWHSLNERKMTVSYTPVVRRINAQGPPTVCNAADPDVVNEN